MQSTKPFADDVGPVDGRESEHHISQILVQVIKIDHAFQVHLDARKAFRKRTDFGCCEEGRHSVRNADADDAFGIFGFRFQIARDRIERSVERHQRARQLFAARRQFDSEFCRDKELRADEVLQTLDLATDGGLAHAELFGGAVEGLRLGDLGEDAQLPPILAAQQPFVHRQ